MGTLKFPNKSNQMKNMWQDITRTNFHNFKMRPKKLIWKLIKTFKILQRCFSAWQLVYKVKAWVFGDDFCSHFIGRGFTNHSKSWIKPQSNTAHYHSCLFFKFRSCIYLKRTKKCTNRYDFMAVGGRKKFFTLNTLIFREANLTLIYVFPFQFTCKFQRINFSVLGIKTRPWKFADFVRNVPWLPSSAWF